MVQARGPIDRRHDLAAALEASGLWAALPPPDRQRLRDEVAGGASPVAGMENIGWRADGEDLADGDVEDLLRSMAEALARSGVSLVIEPVRRPWDEGSSGYAIRVNGEELDLYEFDPDELMTPLEADPWTACTVKPLARVNELLAGVGSSDRIAVFRAGANDGLVTLLPLQAIELLQASDLVPEEDRPVVPAVA